MFEKVKAVIFDIDGTLADSMWIWHQIDIDFLGSRGFEVPDSLNLEIEGMSYTETAIYFKDRFALPESIEEIKEIWHNMAIDYYSTKIAMKKGAKELIHRLHGMGLKLGIATSNSSELVDSMLENQGLRKYFSAIRTSCEVPRGKPYPDVYLKVSEDLGIAPEDCLVFEDTLAGVTAAHTAGMRVIAVSDDASIVTRPEIEKIAESYIDDYTGLLKLLDEKLQKIY